MDAEQIANRDIKRAWIAGIAVGTFQIILGFFSNPYYFLDAAIFYVLSFGIYAKNRVLSVVMLLYCLFNIVYKAYEVQQEEGFAEAVGIVVFLIISWFMFKGVCSVFAYHKITESEAKPKDDQNNK